jgi:hypothetical protein
MALYTVNTASVVNAADINQFTNLLNGTTSGTSVVVSSRIRAQMTGAATGSGGLAGQTSLAAPSSGTYVTGDIVVDGGFGTTWVCTSGGSPGSWSANPTQISTQTLGSNAASVTFSSIPAFNHISVVWKARSSAAVLAEQLYLRFNGDSAAHYFWEKVEGNNATLTSGSSGGAVAFVQMGTITGASGTANCFGSGNFTVAYFNDTTNFSSVQGTACTLVSSSNLYNGTYSGLYNQATSITSLTLFAATGNLVTGSRFSLYGWM